MNQSPKNLIKIMQKRGWVLKRITGSHHLFVHPDKAEIISVPMHGNKDVSTGLFLHLLKKLNIKPEEL